MVWFNLSNCGYLKSSYLCMPPSSPKNIGCLVKSTFSWLKTVLVIIIFAVRSYRRRTLRRRCLWLYLFPVLDFQVLGSRPHLRLLTVFLFPPVVRLLPPL